jgi:2-deoxy-D-gluconate 3-dehydrogenase
MAAQYLSNIFSLEGKSAIVTGGTGGLGSALATALAQAGVSTIVSIELPNDPLSSDLKSKIEGVGGKLLQFHCDLRDPKSLRDCYQSVWGAGVVPDILINCAGVMRRNLCENATDEELDLVSEFLPVLPTYLPAWSFSR